MVEQGDRLARHADPFLPGAVARQADPTAAEQDLGAGLQVIGLEDGPAALDTTDVRQRRPYPELARGHGEVEVGQAGRVDPDQHLAVATDRFRDLVDDRRLAPGVHAQGPHQALTLARKSRLSLL